jgi:tryptophan synthase alpha subunit
MKEAFLMGILAMSANADDNDINLIQIVTPITVSQDGKTVTQYRSNFHYAVTAEDTKADSGPQITRHVANPL